MEENKFIKYFKKIVKSTKDTSALCDRILNDPFYSRRMKEALEREIIIDNKRRVLDFLLGDDET